jgi:hypothetical protein
MRGVLTRDINWIEGTYTKKKYYALPIVPINNYKKNYPAKKLDQIYISNIYYKNKNKNKKKNDDNDNLNSQTIVNNNNKLTWANVTLKYIYKCIDANKKFKKTKLKVYIEDIMNEINSKSSKPTKSLFATLNKLKKQKKIKLIDSDNYKYLMTHYFSSRRFPITIHTVM